MEFGWINLIGAAIVAIMMIPNMLFAIKAPAAKSNCSRIMEIIEQVGRYGCILFMWLPLFVWEFGFHSVAGLLAYIIGNALLLLLYLAIWVVYFRKRSRREALALAVIPTLIFLLSGSLLRHWALVVAALVFGIGHIGITASTHRNEKDSRL